MPDHQTHMPDFETWLEHELVTEISARRRTGRRRVAAATATIGISALVAFAILASAGGGGPIAPGTAQARPLPAIAYRPAATPPPTDEEIGVPGAQTDRARSFSIGPHTGYVVPDALGNWCISVPDLATDDPDVERGTSCTSAADFERYGLYVRVGPVAAAAVPPGAPAPQRVGRFPARSLAVNDDDIAVVTDLKSDQGLALRYKPGVSRADGRSVPRRTAQGVCTDGRRVDRPGDCHRRGMTDPRDMCATYHDGTPPGPCVIPDADKRAQP